MFFREQNDTIFELASMAVNLALWYTKHSAKFAAKEEWVLLISYYIFQYWCPSVTRYIILTSESNTIVSANTVKGSNESGLLQQVVFKCGFY